MADSAELIKLGNKAKESKKKRDAGPNTIKTNGVEINNLDNLTNFKSDIENAYKRKIMSIVKQKQILSSAAAKHERQRDEQTEIMHRASEELKRLLEAQSTRQQNLAILEQNEEELKCEYI